jgi:hypothetical protein
MRSVRRQTPAEAALCVARVESFAQALVAEEFELVSVEAAVRAAAERREGMLLVPEAVIAAAQAAFRVTAEAGLRARDEELAPLVRRHAAMEEGEAAAAAAAGLLYSGYGIDEDA